MSVIDQVGPFTLHAVGDGKPWIKWQNDVYQLWLQYFIPVLAFSNAKITNPIELRWTCNSNYTQHVYSSDFILDLQYADDSLVAYTEYVIAHRHTIAKQLGDRFKLERCILECDEDGVALIDELNSAWIHYRLTRDWNDT